jgi:hypothetical protein
MESTGLEWGSCQARSVRLATALRLWRVNARPLRVVGAEKHPVVVGELELPGAAGEQPQEHKGDGDDRIAPADNEICKALRHPSIAMALRRRAPAGPDRPWTPVFGLACACSVAQPSGECRSGFRARGLGLLPGGSAAEPLHFAIPADPGGAPGGQRGAVPELGVGPDQTFAHRTC